MFEDAVMVYNDGRCSVQKNERSYIIKDKILSDPNYSFAGTTFVFQENYLLNELCDNRKFFERGSAEEKEFLCCMARFKGVSEPQETPSLPLSTFWGIPIRPQR